MSTIDEVTPNEQCQTDALFTPQELLQWIGLFSETKRRQIACIFREVDECSFRDICSTVFPPYNGSRGSPVASHHLGIFSRLNVLKKKKKGRSSTWCIEDSQKGKLWGMVDKLAQLTGHLERLQDEEQPTTISEEQLAAGLSILETLSNFRSCGWLTLNKSEWDFKSLCRELSYPQLDGTSNSTLSHCLKTSKEFGWIESRKQGKQAMWKHSDTTEGKFLEALLALTDKNELLDFIKTSR